jgi:hypothetical protein
MGEQGLIDADFAQLIDDESRVFELGLMEPFFEQRGFATAQKASQEINRNFLKGHGAKWLKTLFSLKKTSKLY